MKHLRTMVKLELMRLIRSMGGVMNVTADQIATSVDNAGYNLTDAEYEIVQDLASEELNKAQLSWLQFKL